VSLCIHYNYDYCYYYQTLNLVNKTGTAEREKRTWLYTGSGTYSCSLLLHRIDFIEKAHLSSAQHAVCAVPWSGTQAPSSNSLTEWQPGNWSDQPASQSTVAGSQLCQGRTSPTNSEILEQKRRVTGRCSQARQTLIHTIVKRIYVNVFVICWHIG